MIGNSGAHAKPIDQARHARKHQALELPHRRPRLRQPPPGERAEQARRDRRNVRQQALVVAERIAAELARDEEPVDVADQVAFRREVVGTEAGRGHEGEQRPVAEQQRGREDRLTARLQVLHGDGREQVTDGDALQHAGPPHLREVELQQAAVNPAEQQQQDEPPQDARVGRRGSALVLLERHRQHDADDEDEQREDQVIEHEPFPGPVLHVVAEPRPPEPDRQGAADVVAARDPEHVEAPQGVDEQEPWRRDRCRSRRHLARGGGHALMACVSPTTTRRCRRYRSCPSAPPASSVPLTVPARASAVDGEVEGVVLERALHRNLVRRRASSATPLTAVPSCASLNE